MDPLAAALDRLVPQSDVEAADLERTRTLLQAGSPFDRSSLLHVTASALVVDSTTRQVLLRWHARQQAWLQVGGHGDPGERDPWAVALREAEEETGLQDLVALTPALEAVPLQLVIVAVPARGDEPAHHHADLRYALSTTLPDAARAENESAPVVWLDPDDAAQRTEDNVRVLIDRLRPYLETDTT
jgi:8-oxo-dGTP pyrophosphatase MutT (NUDIX family)